MPHHRRRPTEPLEQAVSDFVSVRPRLFGIAYRMLGSTTEAEDIVQEIWIRWQTTDRSVVLDPVGFLIAATVRLAINVAQSARVRRETYIGTWLPEPVDTSADPQIGAERGEALELAVLLLLETLTPTERAAYVLREAFDYPYPKIATVLAQSEANARQLVSRARKHVGAGRQERVTPIEQRRLLEAFLAAARVGDLARLETILAADVVSYSDGGGIAGVVRVPIMSRTRVARFVAGFSARFWTDADVEWVAVNGQSGVLVSRDGRPVTLMVISAAATGVDQIMWVMNPVKLAGFTSRSGADLTPGTDCDNAD